MDILGRENRRDRTPAGEWNLNPVAQLSDRASSSVVNANFRELNLKFGISEE